MFPRIDSSIAVAFISLLGLIITQWQAAKGRAETSRQQEQANELAHQKQAMDALADTLQIVTKQRDAANNRADKAEAARDRARDELENRRAAQWIHMQWDLTAKAAAVRGGQEIPDPPPFQ